MITTLGPHAVELDPSSVLLDVFWPEPPQPYRRSRHNGRRHFTDKKGDAYMQGVCDFVRARTLSRADELGLPIDFPVVLEGLFVFARPKRLRTGPRVWCTKSPDADNLVKAIADGLQRPLKVGRSVIPGKEFLADDKWCVGMPSWKVYAASDERPGVHILVYKAPPVPQRRSRG